MTLMCTLKTLKRFRKRGYPDYKTLFRKRGYPDYLIKENVERPLDSLQVMKIIAKK